MSQVLLQILAQTEKASKDIDRFSKTTEKQLNGVEKSFSSISKIAKVAAAGAVAFFAGRRIVAGVKTAIGNAKAYEESLSSLNMQLKLSGTFSEQASKDYEDFASQIQRTTRFGDDAALSVLALAERFGLSGDKAKEFTQAAAELAQVSGQSLDSAARQLSQTLNGQAGSVARLLPGIRDLSEEQLKNGEVIRILNEQYGGTALAATKTYAGAIDQLEKAQGDLSKELGFLITKNPIVIESTQLLAKAFASAADFVQENQEAIIALSKAILDRAKRAFDILRTTIGAINFADLAISIRNVAVAMAGLFVVMKAQAAAKGIQAVVVGLRAMTARALLNKIRVLGTTVFAASIKILAIPAAVAGAVVAVDLLARNFGLLGTAINRAVNSVEIKKLENRLRDLERIAEGTGVGVARAGVLGFGEFSKSAADAEIEIEKIRKKLDELNGTREDLDKTFAATDLDLGLFGQIKDAFKTLTDSAEDAVRDINKSFDELEIGGLGPATGGGFFQPTSGDESSPDFVGPRRPADTLLKRINDTLNDLTIEDFGRGAGRFLEAVAMGADGARTLIREGLVGAAGAILPPGFDRVVGPIFDIATQEPEQIKALVDGFVDEIPVIIDALVEGIPVLVTALVERADDIAIALTEAIVFKLPAALVLAAVEGAKVFIENVIREFVKAFEFLDRVFKNFEKGVNFFFEAFKGLARIFDDIGRLFSDIGRVFQQLVDAISRAGKSLDPTRSDGVLGQIVRGDVKGLGKRLGFAGGLTEVPPGFPNDNFPANLTSGERVVDADTNRDLKDFLSQARSGGSKQPIVVVLQVGQEELARTIVDLDRQGFQIRA
jgi:hypothetical protein